MTYQPPAIYSRAPPCKVEASIKENHAKVPVFSDDSARPQYHAEQGPSTPCGCDVEQPSTPDSAFEDAFASWKAHLPSIRVVGRGFEERRHGGCAALLMLQACRESGAALGSSGKAGTITNSTPFELLAGTASPPYSPGNGTLLLERARSAPTAMPTTAAVKLPPGRKLTAQDSASSMELMGVGIHRLSGGSLPSPTCTSPTTQLLCGQPVLDTHFAPASLGQPWTISRLPAGKPVQNVDVSSRVHGSCSFSDLCEAAAATAMELSASDPAEGIAVASHGDLGPRKLASPRRRLARLDSGILAGGLPGAEA
ncbi:hypothetical protein N2152v2_009413 [Parachlorella kessleri]